MFISRSRITPTGGSVLNCGYCGRENATDDNDWARVVRGLCWVYSGMSAGFKEIWIYISTPRGRSRTPYFFGADVL